MSHYLDEEQTRARPICPVCGNRATESDTQYGIRSSCEPCGLWSWHRYPLADAATHRARREAHEAFDALWRGPRAIVTRSRAYALLAEELELEASECHMKLMPLATALSVPDACRRILEKDLAARMMGARLP